MITTAKPKYYCVECLHEVEDQEKKECPWCALWALWCSLWSSSNKHIIQAKFG